MKLSSVSGRYYPGELFLKYNMCSGCDSVGSRRWSLVEISLALNTPLELLNLQSSFVDNGGDSLSSIRLQGTCRDRGITISVDTILSTTTLLDLGDRINSLFSQVRGRRQASGSSIITKRPNDEMFHLKRKRLRVAAHRISPSNATSTRHRFPLTEMQLSLIGSSLKEHNRNIIFLYETHATDMLPALKRAWHTVLDSEQIFKMDIKIDDSGGYMIAGKQPQFHWIEVVVEDDESYRRELKRPVPTNLALGSSFRVVTLNLPREKHQSTLIWRVHHALIDGTSCELVRSKVHRVLLGQSIQSGPSFGDYVIQLRQLQQQNHEAAVAFWKRKRATCAGLATRPSFGTFARTSSPSTSSVIELQFDTDVATLRSHCKIVGITMASLYCAAWGLALAKYSNTSDVCFGVVLSGRSLPIYGVESVIGPTINTLPLYMSVNTDLTSHNYLQEAFRSLLDLIEFQWSTPGQGFTRNFASAINISPFRSSSEGKMKSSYFEVQSDIPIQIEIRDGDHIRIHYDPSMFEDGHMHRLGSTFVKALGVIQDTSVTVGSQVSSLIGEKEKAALAKMGNWTSKTTRIDSVNNDLVSLFARTARMHPTEIAVEHPFMSLTYAELDARSSCVAKHLAQYVSPGNIICANADKTINWIVAIYAILKTGAIYCPFDTDLPDAIRAGNFTTTGAKLFLTASADTKILKPTSCDFCLSVEELLNSETVPSKSLAGLTNPDMGAYLCFTSGSTGKPKGVMCRHRGLVAFQQDLKVRLGARPGWKIAQFMSPAFDGSIHEIFSALSYGATLVLRDASKPFDHLKKADAAILTPSVAHSLDVDNFPNLKSVYLVGEAVSQSVCNKWAVKNLFNMYGPTEATCGATIKALKVNEPVTLGHPTPSTRIYLLDNQRRLVPWGVVGEIYLAGIQVAVGYIGMSDATSSRFLLDTISSDCEGEYMYKTGDKAYWTEEGQLAFLGRSDREVKLRGFRIDLDDIEVRMVRAHENCTAAAVTVQDGELAAIVQPADLDLVAFKRDIGLHIPSYALPRVIRAFDTFPTTPVGKLDYGAIADMPSAEILLENQEYLMSGSEKLIITALRDILNIPSEVGIDLDTNFADLGADSIVLLSLSHRLSRQFDQPVRLTLLLGSSTVRNLAYTMDAIKGTESNCKLDVLGEQQTSPIEQEWWKKYQLSDETSSFNVSYACSLSSSIDRENFISAWNSVLRRHRILSCKYRLSREQGPIRTYAQNPPAVQLVKHLDLKIANVPFDIQHDYLIRIFISQTTMLVVISHIICDFTTLKILLHEVADTYKGKTLAPVAKVYADTFWTTPAAHCHLSFWTEWLAGAPPCQFPAGFQTTRTRWTGCSHVVDVPTTLYKNMLKFGAKNKFSMHQLALAAVALALQSRDDRCDIMLGAPYMNRNSEADTGVVGLFLEPLPIRIQFPCPQTSPIMPTSDDEMFLATVKRCSRQALSHAVPWSQLLSHLGIELDLPNHPLFDVMVSFHEADHEIRFPIEGAKFVPTWTEGAKFKLMIEFTARSDGTLTLRLEYSDECFTKGDVELIALVLIKAVEHLTSGDSYWQILPKLLSLRSIHRKD